LITLATFTESGARVYDPETGGMRDACPDDWAEVGLGSYVQFNNERSDLAWARGFVAGVLVSMFALGVVGAVVAERIAG
jgi:hypothetical protein